MPLLVHVVRARGLPRLRLLRSPDAYVEVYVHPGAPPSAVSAVAARGCAPEWADFHAHIAVPPGVAPPVTLGVVVRDAGSAGAVAGRAYLRVAASLTEGWFPLTADASPPDGPAATAPWEPPRDPKAFVHPEAEVFVRVNWPEYCSLPNALPVPVPVAEEPDGDPESELRMTSAEPGRFFRCGEMVVHVRALGVPASLRDAQLSIKTGEQSLRGYEVPSPGSSRASGSLSSSEHRYTGSGSVDGDVPSRSRNLGHIHSFRTILSKSEYAAERKPGSRRNVNFGSYSFALFQGTLPDALHLSLRDRGAHNAVAARLLSVAEQNVGLPNEIPGFSDTPRLASNMSQASGAAESMAETSVSLGSSIMDLIRRSIARGFSLRTEPLLEERQDDEVHPVDYVMQLRLTPPGDPASKVVFSVRISYTLWQPPASCNIVTPRFRELMADVGNLTARFNSKYPEAADLTYMFVGGLFTDHYPMYYEHGANYLKERLDIADYQVVPIHTERSVEENARVIRDTVVKAERGPRKTVLIAHSKGGVDVCAAIARYPELAPLLFGFISFQSPFGGTFLIDFLAKSRLAVKGFEGALKLLWGGERDSFLDMGYSSRLRDVLFGSREASSDTKAECETSSSSPPKDGARSEVQVLDDAHVADRLLVYANVPTICFASSAPFRVTKVRTVANAAGFATMAPLALAFWTNTGFNCDGLVAACDARIPYSDLVQLSDMMHTEPVLFFPGTKYPPGELTTVALALLFERNARVAAAE